MTILKTLAALGAVMLIAISGCSWKTDLSKAPNQASVTAAREAGSPVAFSSVAARRHTAQGMDVHVTWQNVSGKTVKQCFMEAYLKDPDGNRLPDEIFRNDSKWLRFDAVIAPNQTHWGTVTVHADVLYQAKASTLHIGTVWVVYENGEQSKPVRVDALAGTSTTIGTME